MAQQQQLGHTELETLNHVMRLVEAFRAFDADNDGLINSTELEGIMGSLGYKPDMQDIKNMMEKGDKNKDGMLNIEEFLDQNTKDLEVDFLGPFRRALQVLDLNIEEELDVVTGEELSEVFGNVGLQLSLEECQNIIAAIDGDRDGAISFDDFKLIVNYL